MVQRPVDLAVAVPYETGDLRAGQVIVVFELDRRTQNQGQRLHMVAPLRYSVWVVGGMGRRTYLSGISIRFQGQGLLRYVAVFAHEGIMHVFAQAPGHFALEI